MWNLLNDKEKGKSISKILKELFWVSVVALFVFTFACMAEVSADTEEVNSDDWAYYVKDGNAIVTGYLGEELELVIPNSLDGYPVTEIQKNGKTIFSKISFESVIFPDTLIEIGRSAFAGCNLGKVVLPDSLEVLAENAFNNTGIKGSLRIPRSVRKIGDLAFCNSTIEKIEFTSNVELGKSVFASCYALSEVDLGYELQSIAVNMFEFTKSLKTIKIPDSVNNIAERAFCESGLTTFKCEAGSDRYSIKNGLLLSRDGKKLILAPPNIQTCIVPEGVTEIGSGAFAQNYEMESVYLPQSLKMIGEDAFIETTGISSISIPRGVERIEKGAFAGAAIEYLELPSSLQYIGTRAFENWIPDLTRLVYYEGDELQWEKIQAPRDEEGVILDLVDAEIFFSSPYDPDNHRYYYDYQNGQRFEYDYLEDGTIVITDAICMTKEVIFPDVIDGTPVSTLGSSLLCNTGITDVYIPEGITRIERNIFADCEALKTIILPKTISYIGDGAFNNCTALTAITLPEGLSTIEPLTFYYCKNLKSISIPRTVTMIGDNAFNYCIRLENIEIPEGVTRIEESAFRDCKSLAQIVLPNTIKDIGPYAFSGCYTFTSLKLPVCLASIGDNAFSGCKALKNVSFEYGLSVDHGTDLYDGVADERVIEPSEKLSIGKNAFDNCQALEQIELLHQLSKVSASAFNGCNALTEVLYYGNEADLEIVEVSEGNEALVKALECRDNTARAIRFDQYETIIHDTDPSADILINHTLYPANAIEIPLSFTSSDESVASVDEAGHYVINGTGKCIITAESGSDEVKQTLYLNVLGLGIREIILSTKEIRIKRDQTHQLTVDYLPVTATNTEIIWASSDETVASVNENGLVTAHDVGSVTISATTQTGNCSAECIVNVISPVIGINIENNNIRIEPDQTVALKAIIQPEDATNKEVTWSSSDEAIASVAADGLVTGKKPGTAVITVTSEDTGISAECQVTVAVFARSITLDKNELTIVRGEEGQLQATVMPENATDPSVIWTTADENIATVDQNGFIKAVSGGQTTITATTGDGGYTATCIVNVIIPATEISLEKTELSMTKGESMRLSASLLPEDTTETGIKWSSSDEHIAIVDEEGNVTALSGGTVIIKATTETGSYSAECTVYVFAPVTEIQLDVSELTLVAGEQAALHADILPADASNKEMVWSAENEAIATVDPNGLVTAVAPGSTTITVTAVDNGVSATCSINVRFGDVTDTSKYYYEPVLWAVQQGITSGTSAGSFSPDQQCTRGQIVTFLWRAAGAPEPTSTVHNFTDIQEGKYYYKAVLWAVENNITSGLTATTFGPNAPCTRGQVVTFMWRAKGKPQDFGDVSAFQDVKAGKYYYDPVRWAVKAGVTQGTSKTAFSPDGTCTRGQIVTFLYRAYKYLFCSIR